MTAPAIIRATYSDLRLIKGRKVCQIVLEIPQEQAEAFVAAFGMPVSAESKWVAVALLRDEAKLLEEAEPEKLVEPKEHRRFNDLRPSLQAVFMCKEPRFWSYMGEHGSLIFSEDQAAHELRETLNVKSRSELDTNPVAMKQFQDIRNNYHAWLAIGA